MHEKRNFCIVLGLVASIVWAILTWFVIDPGTTGLSAQRIAAPIVALLLGIALFWAVHMEDKLPNHLAGVVGNVYYDADGLSFLPTVRTDHGHAELCVYYQNRFEGPVQAIIHLRPIEECFVIRPGVRDLHFAFRADGGDFGVIRQPIAVPENLQGEVAEVLLAAATFYPRSHGTRLRRQAGMPCGSLLVDWGSAFRTGVHEVSGEIELRSPAHLHLALPQRVDSAVCESSAWRQERFFSAAGT